MENQTIESQMKWQAFVKEQELEKWCELDEPWLAELSQWQLLIINGVDAKTFLQGQLSCDMESVTQSQAQLGACINLKGRVISNFIVIALEDENTFCLACPPGTLASVSAVLKKYAIFSKVEITTDENKLALACHSPALEEPSSNIQGFSVPSLREGFLVAEFETLKSWWLSGDDGKHCSSHIFASSCIEQAVFFMCPPWLEIFTPQEINLELVKGVSFNKGCYTGQEVVARLHYRGKPKRRLYRARLNWQEQPLELGEGIKIMDENGKEQGHILTNSEAPAPAFNALLSINIAFASNLENGPKGLDLKLSSGLATLEQLSTPPYPLTIS